MLRPPKPRVHKHTVMNKPRGGGVRAPVLLISGNWIAAAGFKIGAKYTAVSDEERERTAHSHCLQTSAERAETPLAGERHRATHE